MNRVNQIETDRLGAVLDELSNQLHIISALPVGKSLENTAKYLDKGHPAMIPLQDLARSERHYQNTAAYAQRRGHGPGSTQRGGATTSSKGADAGSAFQQRLQQDAGQVQENTRALLRVLEKGEEDAAEVYEAAYSVQKAERDARKQAEREELEEDEEDVSEAGSEDKSEASQESQDLRIASQHALELSRIFSELKDALQVKLSVTVEQQRAKYEFIRNLEERIRQAESEQRLLKEELRRVRQQRESELTSITDTADRLKSELGDLEEHAEAERTNLKSFVDRKTQELDEQHIAQTENLEQEQASTEQNKDKTKNEYVDQEQQIRKKRNQQITDLNQRLLSEYDNEMLSLENKMDALRKVHAREKQQLEVLRKYFDLVDTDLHNKRQEEDSWNQNWQDEKKRREKKEKPAALRIQWWWKRQLQRQADAKKKKGGGKKKKGKK
eukprot:gb/GECG01003861.1/.p1 GENE.gb/GECG01003861.1/~~gb/GECG01003861.1/.p1  ORF type:complete len:442 (+),score=102.03 gb/GECG01003861.1/:1-1326(+)